MKKVLITTLALVSMMVAHAQKDSDWKKDFQSRINWYRITDAGTVMVATREALYGISPEGKELWKADDIENIREENVDPIDGTPYVTLVKAGLMKGYNKVIDVFSGKTLVNTQDYGLNTVIKRLYLSKSNSILFYGTDKSGKFTTVLVNLATGNKIWDQSKLFEKKAEQLVSQAGELADGILLATDKRIYKLNNQTGEIAYSIDMKSDLPVVPVAKGGFGSAFSGKNASATQTASSAAFFQTEDKSKFYFWNQDILTQFDAATGKEIWKRFELPSPISYILHDSRGMIITTAEKRQEDVAKANKGGGGLIGKISRASAASKNRASLILLDPNSGGTKWDSDDIGLKGDVLAYKLVGNKLILATELDKGDNFISIVDLDAGKSITKKPISIKGDVRDLQLVPQGIYFRTSEEINIMDLESGEKSWKKGFKVKNCIGINENSETGYVYGNGKVYKVDFNKGELNEWIQSLDFKKGDEPTSVSVYEGNIFIAGEQNAALFDKSGNPLYKTYVEPPGRTMGGKLLSGLGGAASMALGAAGAAQSAQLSFAKGYYGSTDPALDRSIKSANDLASSGFSAGIAGFKSISKRFSATTQANGFVAMLTKFGGNSGKDAGITIISKADGKRISDMLLGDKKDPDYKLDELERVVYYRSGSTIEGFKF
ncbi:MAG: PQQ-binding-like beta-propeller repeat protein [Chitinophagaceae bacterium]|nr:PQQ-binding-like beta-propeller repeat protein [Chitinophagaceae bacterium]